MSKKKLLSFIVLTLWLWQATITAAFALVMPLSSNIRLSGASTDPLNTGSYTALTSINVNSGVIPLRNANGWQSYQCPGFTVTVPSTVGQIIDVFAKPGTAPGTIQIETDAWNPTQTQFTISSATATTPTTITTSATPSGIVVGSLVLISTGTGSGTLYTDSTFGLNGQMYTVASVVGSVITLTGTNTTTLSVSGASGGKVSLIPTTRTTAVSYVDGIIVQTANNNARLIGTFLTGARGVSGQTESSSTYKFIWNANDISDQNLYNFVYNAIGSSSAIQSTIGAMENNLTMYTVSGSPLADSSGAVATLYGGGMYTNVQTFYNGSSGFYNELVGQFSITITGTAGIPEDVYIQGGGIGSTTVTVTEVAWANATTPPSRGTDPAGRLCQNGNTAALLLGAYVPATSTTVIDNSGSRLISGALIRRPRAVLAKDATASWSTTSSTPVAANGSTVNGVGQAQVFTCVQAEPIYLTNYSLVISNGADTCYIQIQLDGTACTQSTGTVSTSGYGIPLSCFYSSPQIGLHTYSRTNWQAGSLTATFYGGINGNMTGTVFN